MIVESVKKTVDPVTYEVRYHFTGSITPETMQDVIHGSYGMSIESFCKDFFKEIREKHDA